MQSAQVGGGKRPGMGSTRQTTGVVKVPSYMNLQATLAAATVRTLSHHPIFCRSDLLVLEEDGRMGCEHLYAPAGDPRTQGAIDQSISILLIELLAERENRAG